jgi:lycopene cyclase CruP
MVGGQEKTILQAFVDEGLMTVGEVDDVIVAEFNPVRVAFEGVAEIITRDILNCGVSPRKLLELLKRRFLGAGG